MYPHIFNANRKLPVVAITGQVTISLGTDFKFEDVPFNTDDFTIGQRQFALGAYKTYHLRFTLDGESINSFDPGNPQTFYLVDLSDNDYNPGGIYQEYDPVYDTTRKDAKFVTIITDGSAGIEEIYQHETLGISKLSLPELIAKIGGSSGASIDDILYNSLKDVSFYNFVDYDSFSEERTLERAGDPLPDHHLYDSYYGFQKGTIGYLDVDVRKIVSYEISNAVDTPMTDYNLPKGLVVASSDVISHEGWRAFDHDDVTYWETDAETSASLEFNFDGYAETEKIVSKFSIKITSDADASPKNFNLKYYDVSLGSWVIFRSYTNVTWTANEKKDFITGNVESKQRWLLDISANNGGASIKIAEVELYEGVLGVTDRFLFHAEYTDGYLIPGNSLPVMYANSTPDGDVSASTEVTPAWHAADNDEGTQWEASALTGWWEFEFPERFLVTEFELTARYDGSHASGSPEDFYIKAWDEDAAGWDILVAATGETWSTALEKKRYVTNNRKNYKRFQLEVTANTGGTNLAITNFAIFRGVIPRMTFQYSVDDRVTWDPVFEDEDMLLVGGFDKISIKAVGEDVTNLKSVGLLYGYDINNASGSTQLYAVYEEAVGQTAPFDIILPDNKDYVQDNQSLHISFWKDATKATFPGIRGADDTEGNYKEKNSREITCFIDLAVGDKIVFWQPYGSFDVSVDNLEVLGKEHDASTGEHKLPDINNPGFYGHVYYKDGELYINNLP